MAVDPSNPSDRSAWTDVIPESEHLLEGVSTAGGDLFATYLRNACNAVIRYDLDGSNAREIALPNATGSTGGFGGKNDATELFYAFTSFTYPTSIFRYDMATGESTPFYVPDVDFDPAGYESKQVFYPSKDGTMVPMFIVHKKGLEMDGQRPTMLYAYGGFNISLTPSFSTSNIVLLEQGGVYAMPNLRGGGEFGEDWHEGGMLLKKQNVFDDFIAAGEYLIAEGYTSNDRLAIAGGSNGGLLVGATMAQRPELASVAFPAVGVMDMLRYHKFTDRLGLDSRVRLLGQLQGPLRQPLRLLSAAQPQRRHGLPRHNGHHGRPRRPRGPGAQLQVRRAPAGRPRWHRSRDDPHRNQRRPRRGQADWQNPRRAGRQVGLHAQRHGLRAAVLSSQTRIT